VTSATTLPDLPVSSRRLWFGVIAAPVAWLTAELVGYLLVAQGCGWSTASRAYAMPGAFAIFVAVTIVCLLVALAGLVVARANWRRIADAAPEPPIGAEPALAGRVRFLAFTGMVASGLFLLGLVLFGVLPLLLETCSEVH